MTTRILTMPGDGVGPEICNEAIRVLDALRVKHGLDIAIDSAVVGGAAIDAEGTPLPEESLQAARQADAVLFGSIGGPKWDDQPRENRPESGLLRLRAELGLFANLRPAILYPQLAHASSLQSELVSGLDIMIVRELTGGIYFGQPSAIETRQDGVREGYNTMRYDEQEISRIGRAAMNIARARTGRLTSVDKANVLNVSQLWRDVMNELAAGQEDIELNHMYVDNAAMQLIREPKQFDTIVTGNLFGDILSDAAAMLTGSIGMLPSASLDANGKGLYEPVHGSAPDIAGRGVANPLAMILSLAMLLRYTLGWGDIADEVETAVGQVLDQGLRTPDIMSDGMTLASTEDMGAAVVDMLS